MIATAGVCEDGEIQSEVAELPAELDIEVEAVALDDQEIDTLRHDTRCGGTPALIISLSQD